MIVPLPGRLADRWQIFFMACHLSARLQPDGAEERGRLSLHVLNATETLKIIGPKKSRYARQRKQADPT